MKRVDLRVIGALYIMGGRDFAYSIMQTAHLSSARLYPALERLEAEGLIRSGWETDVEGRKRMEYRLVPNLYRIESQ